MATDRSALTGAMELRNCAFRTDDLDEAVEFVTSSFGTHSRVPRQRGPLGFSVMASISGRAASGLSSCSVAMSVRTAARFVMVHLPLHPGSEYRVGRRTLRSRPDVAVLISPGHDYTVDAAPGDTLAFLLEPALLERAIDECRVRRPGNWTLRSMHLSLSAASLEILQKLVRQHGEAIARVQLTRQADELWALEDRLAAWLARQVVDADGLVPLSPSSRQIGQRVDAWIRQNLSQPIALEQLRAASGVSARTLQEACLAHWGQTPLELVAARRLDAVRSMLEAGTVPTVTEAAVRSGFSHLGRFSITYRRAFGESPSETLARASAAPVPRRRVLAPGE